MTKRKSTWKYNKLLTGRRNYYAFAGPMVRSTIPPIDSSLGDAQNPNSNPTPSYNKLAVPNKKNSINTFFNKLSGNPNKDGVLTTGAFKGMDQNGVNAVKAIGSVVGGVGSGLLSGGMTSTAGNVLSGISSVASAIPGPWGAVVSAGAGVAGGIVNKLWGSKMNTENIAKVEANINNLNNFQSNASDFDTLASNWINADTNMTFDNDYIGKDGVFSHKVADKADDLRSQLANGTEKVYNTLANNAENISDTTMQTLLGHSAAFGGELNTQGGDFTNGLLYIDNGGSHEANPYEGVQLGVDKEGVPNLVEEGETIFDNYVFSKRLMVPKDIKKKYKLGDKKISFADASKKLAKESEERPNDPISQRGLQAFMDDLANSQEELKAKKQQKEMLAMQQMNPIMQEQMMTPDMPQEMQDEIPQEDISSMMEDTQMAAYGGKVNRFDYGTNSLWNSFTYNNIPLMVNGKYAPIYTDSKFQDWIRSKEGTDFLNKWWKNNNSNSKRKQFTVDELLGTNTDGLLYSDTYGDAQTFGKEAFAEYMKTANTPIKTRRFLQQTDKDGKVIGVTPINDYYEGYNDYGVSYMDSHKGRRQTGSVIKDFDKDNNTYYNDIYYQDPYVEPAKDHYVVFRDKDGKQVGNQVLFDNAMRDGSLKGYHVGNTGKDKDGNDVTYYDIDDEIVQGKYADWLRYAPALGFGIASITDALGLTNKPDYSNAEALIEASRDAGNYQPVKFRPVGNYLTYKPFDRDIPINKMNAEAGATRRSIMNTSGNNRATAMAGILAADNNYLNQIGNLTRQAEEYNLAQRQQVEEFNRGTNTTNSQGFLQADMANQEALAKTRDLNLRGLMQGYQTKDALKQAADAGKSANLSGLFQSIGDIGFEEYNARTRDLLASKGIVPGGESFGRIKIKNSKGGKINRKKGLTF